MGEYAEMALDYEINMAMNGPRYVQPEPDYEVWNQRDGTPIPVANMTDSHIRNTIAMLRRGNRPDKYGYIKRMELELKGRAV